MLRLKVPEQFRVLCELCCFGIQDKGPFVLEGLGIRDYAVLGKRFFVGQESGRGSVRESGLFSNTFAMYAQASYCQKTELSVGFLSL